jgi:hypothetical protein
MDNVKTSANLDVARLISDFSDALSLVNGRTREPGIATQVATSVGPGPLQENRASAGPEAEYDALEAGAAGSHVPLLPFQPDRDAPIEDDLLEDVPADNDVIERFLADHETLERLDVTASEIEALREVRLCGSLTCRADVLQILRSIRGATQLPQIVRTSPLMESDGGDLDFSDKADRIRREALARLNEPPPPRLHRLASLCRAVGATSAALLMIRVFARNCLSS